VFVTLTSTSVYLIKITSQVHFQFILQHSVANMHCIFQNLERLQTAEKTFMIALSYACLTRLIRESATVTTTFKVTQWSLTMV